MAARSGVLFDIDGTLVDTTYLHTEAWRRAFLEHGMEVVTADIHRHVGMGSSLFMEALIGGERDDVKAAWRRHFEGLKPEIRPLPGARALLQAVADSGAAVVLASSSEQDDLRALVDALDADGVIDVVISAGDVEEAKPEPDVFEVAVARSGVDRERAVVVGDTVWDVEAAARCGLSCVGVLTGGIGAGELEAAGAVAVYATPGELLDRLPSSPLARLLA